jgi:hypothetical protein
MEQEKEVKQVVDQFIDKTLESLDLYKIQPWHSEDRSNLRAYGITAPVKLINVEDILVIHIKANLSVQDMEQLNTKLRFIFGPFTLVFAFDSDIDFLSARKMSLTEIQEWTKKGCKLIVGEIEDAKPNRDHTK